jgi:hypothetical protein
LHLLFQSFFFVVFDDFFRHFQTPLKFLYGRLSGPVQSAYVLSASYRAYPMDLFEYGKRLANGAF